MPRDLMNQCFGAVGLTTEGVSMTRIRRFSSSVALLLLFGCQRDALTPNPTSTATGPLFSESNPPSPGLLASSGHILFVRILPPLDREVFKMDATGANVTQLGANGYAPAWKPDGSQFAFNCGVNICVMNTDGSGKKQLTFNVLAEGAHWSPDGSRIAFVEQDQTGNSHVYVMNADGTNPAQLTIFATGDGSPEWSPDGTKFAFGRKVSGTFQVLVMNDDGTGLVQLTSSPGGSFNPAWSPNGALIAFDSNRSGTRQVYVMNSDGSTQASVPNTTGGSGPTWSLDGNRIAFTCPAGKTTNICAINYPGGTGLVDLTNSRRTEMSPAWGP